jgi:RNA polymerase sigma-70 factor (ECF subfamily)
MELLEPDVQQLWQEAATGDDPACRRLVEALYPVVIRIVRSHLPRRVAEEDLTQEIFMKMFARLHQYRGDRPVSHWVSRIAVTTCLDHLRAQKRRPELRWADLNEDEAAVVENLGTVDPSPSAQDALHSRELVQKLLETLRPDDRLVLRLLDLEEKSVAEIKVLTGWSASLIKIRAFRARRKLRKTLEHWKEPT